ncbi:MAG TPA: hypothetical protein DHU62_03705 [Firmicutes bacterium]|nr:hypothetical protein [Bacillota bacterium]
MYYGCIMRLRNCAVSTRSDKMNLGILNDEENCYSLKELLDLYSKYIKNPMVVINHNYELLYYTKTTDADNVYKEATNAGVWSLELIAIANNAFKNKSEYVILDSINKNKRRLFYKIEHNTMLGYLVFLETDDSTLDCLDYNLIRHLANSIGKILYLEDYKKNDTNIQSFYEALLNAEYKTKDILKTKIEEYKVNLNSSLLIISLSHASFTQNNYIKLKLESILSINSVIAYDDNVLVFFSDDNIPTSKLKDLLIYNHLTALYVKKILDYFSFSLYYKALANLLCFLEDSKTDVLYYELDYKMYLPFFTDKYSLNEIRNFIDLKIMKIYNDDIKNKTDNINTIYYYLSYDKSLSTSAIKLFVHRNTVSYRLMKISETYDINFNDLMQNKIYLHSIILVKYYNYKLNN